jgi:hypothetical protein
VTISELYQKLKDLGIPDEKYYLHGLYGSTDDNEKPALTIKRGKYFVEYETYFKERGEKYVVQTFMTEDEVCNYLHKQVVDNWTVSSPKFRSF